MAETGHEGATARRGGAAAVGRFFKTLGLVLAALLIGVGGTLLAVKMGAARALTTQSTNTHSVVVESIKTEQQVILLNLAVKDMVESRNVQKVFGKEIPWTDKTEYMRYSFHAKLGFDGKGVTVASPAEHQYALSIPEFQFLGADEPTFEVAVTKNGVLSWTTPSIDRLQAAQQILSTDAQRQHVVDNRAQLEAQAQAFYDGIIKAIDPKAEITYEFRRA